MSEKKFCDWKNCGKIINHDENRSRLMIIDQKREIGDTLISMDYCKDHTKEIAQYLGLDVGL